MRPKKSSHFGQLLLLARIKQNLLQKQLALTAEIDPSYLAGIESGRRPVPRAEVLQKILSVLNLTKKEHQALEDAAAWESISSYLEKTTLGNPKIQALTSLSKLFHAMSDRQAMGLVSLIELFIEENSKEAIMK